MWPGAVTVSQSHQDLPPGSGLRSVTLAVATLLMAATWLVFSPGLANEFVDWDEQVFIVSNPHVQGFTRENIAWAFTTFDSGPYQPLTWLSFQLDEAIWGLDPRGFHFSNILLHSLNAVLFLAAALWLFRRSTWHRSRNDCRVFVLGGAVAAAVFALHPMRVESVAWAFERKDVLSGFFFLGSILLYFRAVDRGDRTRLHRGWKWTSVFVFALSLLSKPSGVALPLVLMLLDFSGRWRGSALATGSSASLRSGRSLPCR